MKKTKLGEFEELVLLTVAGLQEDAYGVEIKGDMEEIFRDNVERLSYRKARRIYVWEMLRLFRPILIRHLKGINFLLESAMLENYFKVSLRGLMKNPLSSFINVFGLAVAI